MHSSGMGKRKKSQEEAGEARCLRAKEVLEQILPSQLSEEATCRQRALQLPASSTERKQRLVDKGPQSVVFS